ncbi:hypothetical protein ABHN11_11745 [Brevibacillus centrosporus]|uniref:CTP synthase C-terminal region-related (seleno)protein n=1 Tax=Brevibacillus centrosporus TaxID=54910 RepID=UPI003D1E6B05
MYRIGLIGDYNPEVVAHGAIPRAIELAAKDLGKQVEVEWILTPRLVQAPPEEVLSDFDGLWAVPGSPYKSKEGVLQGISYARENLIPFLGTCGGFQHMVIEFARNVLGLAEADHAEDNPAASLLIVAPLTCSVSQQTHIFTLTEGSRIARIYGRLEIAEQYGTCNYGVNAAFTEKLVEAGLCVGGVDTKGEVRLMEYVQHPFFIGTLFQPERSAFQGIVHPLLKEFVFQATQQAKGE